MSDPHRSATSNALAELARIVTEAQANNPLAPVTIMVPSHVAGLDVTRYLGRTLNDGAGHAAVHAYTLKDLATELIGADPAVRGRAPLPPTIRLGAISKALTEQPGIFAPVADQPATVRAIARTAVVLDSVQRHPETKHLETQQPTDAFPQLTQEVLRLHAAAADALHTNWYTQHESFTVAAEKLQEPAVKKRLGTVIGFMLRTELQPDALMFRNRLEAAGMQHINAAGTVDEATTVITASDADDETRAVARLVVEQLDAGTPGHRIGVFYSVAQPYNALLTQRLAEVGVTFAGPAPRTLTDSPFARGLLQLLALDTADPDKRTILNILSEGTLVWREHELPSSATCERLHSNPPGEEEDDDGDTGAGAMQSRSTRDRESFALFDAFLTALTSQVKSVQTARSWAEVSTALTTLIDLFLGPRTAQEPPERANARDTLRQLGQDLTNLDRVGPLPRPTLVGSTLEDAINSKGGWVGKIGAGVVIGRYQDAVGRDLDVVYLIGAAEGRAPTRISEDPLLPDAVRASLNGNLPTVEQRAQARKEQFFAALASGTHKTIMSPRGDLRAAGSYELTRWISGARIPTEKRDLPSFAHSLEHGAPTTNKVPVTEQEWRIRNLLTASNRAEVITEDPVLNRSVTLTRDRHDGVFSRFNGNLGAQAGSIMDPDRPLSPTRLEDWVTSPFSYFLKHVLKVSIFEDVGLEVQISLIQRGNLVHKILEDYVREVADDGRQPSSDRLLELAEAAFTEFTNPAWLAHVWDRHRARIRQDLHQVFDTDHATAADGWSYLAAEASFGPEETDTYPPVELTLDDDSSIRFRGKVDRIDQHDDGRLKVIDYKTGGSSRYKKLKTHPTAEGSRFQLPVYGLFARTLASPATSDVAAQYWFISSAGGFANIGYEVSDDVITQLREDASLIITAIRGGVFPMRPESTSFTSFTNLMGVASVGQNWIRLQNAPELVPYAELLKAEK